MVQRDRGEVRVPELAVAGVGPGRPAARPRREARTGRRPGRDIAAALGPQPRLGPVAGPADAAGSTSCAATSTSTARTPTPSCIFSRQQHPGPARVAAPGRRRDVRLRRGRSSTGTDYLVDVHVPAVVEPMRAFSAMRRPPTARPEARRDAGGERRGGLRHGRHAAVEQRRRVLPLAPAAGARRTGQRAREVVGRRAGAPPLARHPDAATGRRSCGRSTGATRAPDSAELEQIVDDDVTTTDARPGCPPARSARSASIAPPGTASCWSPAPCLPLTRPIAALFDEIVAAELAVDDGGPLHRPPGPSAAGR